MGTRLSLEIAPEHLTDLLGCTEKELAHGFKLVDEYHGVSMQDDGYPAYCAMMDDPVAATLSFYRRPFEYDGKQIPGALEFGKRAFDRCWELLEAVPETDPLGGTVKRVDHRDVVALIIDRVMYLGYHNVNFVVFADHCTGVTWG